MSTLKSIAEEMPAAVAVSSPESLVSDDALAYEELLGKIEALGKSQATIEFDLEGTILSANENFLDTVGYTLDEIQGQHHRMFVEPAHAQSEAYRQFWKSLKSGQYQSGEYKRIGKGGKEVWLQASYNPISANGQLAKIVKYATDITDEKLQHADYKGQIEAVKKSQAVIEFDLEGTILSANENFLDTVGYALGEIQGRHHRMFVDDSLSASSEYTDFWAALNRGEYQAGEFQRIGKNGKVVWLQASYNPILDPDGRPFKVVKYATDITERKKIRAKTAEVGQNVGTSVTQMAQTIQEISSSVSRTASLAKTTETAAKTAGMEIQELSSCSQAIDSVVELIRDLAEQTNMLALNATIEAARAGDAGRGFAVVASEVKELAKQTANATEKIAESVSGIRSSIDAVVVSTQEIESGVSEVSQNTTTVAAAIEEQSVTMANLGETAEQLLALTNNASC